MWGKWKAFPCNISYPKNVCSSYESTYCCYEIKDFSSIYPVSYFSFMMQDEVKGDITPGLPLHCSVGPESLMMQCKVKNDTAGLTRKSAPRKTSGQFLFLSPKDVFLDFR